MTKQYKQLLNIKRPVMIVCCKPKSDRKHHRQIERVRILYPNGHCEYLFEFWDSTHYFTFAKSCYIPSGETKLKTTVEAMYKWDRYEYPLRKFKVVPL